MPNIIRGIISIPFSAEVDAEITDGASLLDYYDKHAWQFVDFAQHEDTDTVITWEKGCGVEVTEFVSDATLEDEFARDAA
jgi:hypothetical protein